MSPGRLNAIRREIGLIMGWKAQSYTARRFAEDLNQRHPGLVSIAADGQPYRLKRVIAGRSQPPPYWDKVVEELQQLAIVGCTHPPTPGPLWFGVSLIRAECRQVRQGMKKWRAHLGWTQAELAKRVNRAGLGSTTIKYIETRRALIRPDQALCVARALDVTIDELISGPQGRQDGASPGSWR